MAVARITRIGEQPFAARIGEGGKSKVQRTGGAVGDGDATGRHGNAVALLVESGNHLAQFRQAERLRVQRFAAFDRVDRCGGYRRRRREIRFADFHVDDVATFGFELAGAGQQFDDVEGLDLGKTGGGAVHGRLQCKTATGLEPRWPFAYCLLLRIIRHP